PQVADRTLDGRDPVAQPAGLLVAEALREVAHPRHEARRDAVVDQPPELLGGARLRRALSRPPVAERAVRRRCASRDDAVGARARGGSTTARGGGCARAWAGAAGGPAGPPRARPGARGRGPSTRSARPRRAPPRPTAVAGRCGSSCGGAPAGRAPSRRRAPG